MNFIKLTHFSTGNVTYLKSESITGVSQGFDRSLVFVEGQQPAHYREGAEYIMDLIHGGEYPPAVEYDEPTQADFEMGHVAGVCDLGPLPQPNEDIIYTVTADYDMHDGNSFEHKVFRNRLEAVEFFHGLVADFNQIVRYQLCQEDSDFENMDEAIPNVYLVDADHENFARITVEELTIV
jgi:hypothetical protein